MIFYVPHRGMCEYECLCLCVYAPEHWHALNLVYSLMFVAIVVSVFVAVVSVRC